MARIDWVVKRLQEWGKWRAMCESNGLGYPKQSAFARLLPSGSSWGSSVPVDSLECSKTDEAVRSLLLNQSHLYRVLECIYVQQLGLAVAAKRLCRAKSTVSANLDQADHAIAAWFQAHDETTKKSFTT